MTKRRTSRTDVSIPLSHENLSANLEIGNLLIGTTNNVLPLSWTSCLVKLFAVPQEHLLLEFGVETVLVQLQIELEVIKSILQNKVLRVHFRNENELVYVSIYFVSLPLPTFNNHVKQCLKLVFELLFGIREPIQDEDVGVNNHKVDFGDVNSLYKDIETYRRKEITLSSVSAEHPKLKPRLRKYQEEAVNWMLYMENRSSECKEILNPLYTKVTLKSGLDVYFDKYSGYVEKESPILSIDNKGGILADEMGLGKTVEVLACILLNSDNSDHLGNDCDNRETIIDCPLKPERTETRQTAAKNVKPSNGIHSNKRKSDGNSENEEDIKRPKLQAVPSKKRTKSKINREALRMWYESALSEVSKRKQPKPENTSSVQCICGGYEEEGAVECVDCGKNQHAACMSYKKTYGSYRCPQCWNDQPLLSCPATLIVCPCSLKRQWGDEIQKHSTGLRVLQYEGFSTTPVYPHSLQEYDIVLTTYSVLQSEIRLINEVELKQFRRQKRYALPGTPLTRVRWWRLCLDEAQTIESPTMLVAEMARKLNVRFRWAVTGTPISKEISDLYGLINYLQLKPYDDAQIWKNILYRPYQNGDKEPMYQFLSKVLWRSAKSKVLDQINIPNQTTKEYWFEFSAVEKYFYQREHELSCNNFLVKVNKYNPNKALTSISREEIKKILAPLLYIRQACSNPSTVRGRYLVTKKQVSSMKELLEALIQKNINEGEDALRKIVSAINGIGGVHLLLHDPQEAVAQYRKVLQYSARFNRDEQEVGLSVDKLQLIHTMHNLADILDAHRNQPEGLQLPPTLRDSSLRDDCNKIEQDYIKKFRKKSYQAYKESCTLTATVDFFEKKFNLPVGQWFSELLECITLGNHYEELVSKILTVHCTANVKCDLNFTSEQSILYLITIWDDELNKLRDNLLSGIKGLYKITSDGNPSISVDKALIRQATVCHLRPDKKNKRIPRCSFCKTNDALKKYEFKLFTMKKRTETYEQMSLQGSWKPSSEELILKAIISLGKLKNSSIAAIKDGENHIQMIEALKKEFKEIRKFWTLLDQQICAEDELDICKTRLMLKEPTAESDGKERRSRTDEVLRKLSNVIENKTENIHLLNEHELEYQRTVLENEERQAVANLERNLGVQSYLETLRRQQYEGQSPDPCPICGCALEKHWSILPCGHSFCLECINALLERDVGSLGQWLRCSVCRVKQPIRDISYIRTDGTSSGQQIDENGIRVQGNYSTKVEALVRLLLELRQHDPHLKVLLFSFWPALLKFLKGALVNNDITCELLLSSGLAKRLENFKDPKKNIMVLLIPIGLGAKGLNLIEATHVILAEPLLDPADELQAIGRVHRIGQTKPTFVHKFAIKHTIEENIRNATASNVGRWHKNNLTVGQLRGLFGSVSDNITDHQSESHLCIPVDEASVEATEMSTSVEVDAVDTNSNSDNNYGITSGDESCAEEPTFCRKGNRITDVEQSTSFNSSIDSTQHSVLTRYDIECTASDSDSD